MDTGRVKTGRKSEWMRRSVGSLLAAAASVGAIKMLWDMQGGPPKAQANNVVERVIDRVEERVVRVEVEKVVEVEVEKIPAKAVEKNEPTPADLGAVGLFNNCSKNVVKVLAFGKEGVRGQGSGFFVTREGWVATNEHVIRGKSGIQVEMSDGKTASVKKVIAVDRQADLAILDVGIEHDYLPLAVDAMPIGTKVYAIGSPRELSNTLSEGLLSGYRDISKGVRRLQTTAPISPGSSGGPLLDDRGRVVGVTCGFRDDGQNLNFAVTAGQLKEMMEINGAYAKDEGTARWWLVQAMREMTSGETGPGQQAMYLEIALAAKRVGENEIEKQATRKAQESPSGIAMDERDASKLKVCSNFLEKGDLGGACAAASEIQQMQIRGQALGLICGYLSVKMNPRELVDWIDNQEGPGELRARACLGAMGK